MSVEDEIETLPGLRERAKAEFEAALVRKCAFEEEIVADLEGELFDFLIHTLEIDRGTAASLEYKRGEKSVAARDDQKVDTPSPDITVEVKIDGVRLRAHYVQVQIMGKKSDSFGEEKIMGDEFKVECHNGRGWYEVRSLANLGKMLS